MPAARIAERHGVRAGVVPPVLAERALESLPTHRSLAEVGAPHDAVLVADHELAHAVARLHREIVDARRGLDVEVRIGVQPLATSPTSCSGLRGGIAAK